MEGLTILAWGLILYGLATLYVALAKPTWVWNLAKFKGFIQVLGERGTMIFLVIVGVFVAAIGIIILLN